MFVYYWLMMAWVTHVGGWGRGGEGGRLFCFPSSLIMIIESTRMLFIMVIIIGIMAVLKTEVMIIKIKQS